MDSRTTIAIPRPVRDRLRRYGRKAATYAEVLGELMDRIDPRELLVDAAFLPTRDFPDAEVQALRRQNPAERLRIAEAMRQLAAARDIQRTRRSAPSLKKRRNSR